MRNFIIVISGLAIFCLLILLAFLYRSPIYFVYASAIPLVVIPFLPDNNNSQTIKLNKKHELVDIFRIAPQTGEDAQLLVISFQPGYIKWNHKWVFFPIGSLSNIKPLQTNDFTAALSILSYDLAPHPRKKGLVGIYLPSVAERTSGLPFTVREANRFVIRIEDLHTMIPSSVNLTNNTSTKSINA